MNPQIIIICVSAFISYGTYNYISYSEFFRSHRLFFVMGLALALVSNLLWLYGVKVLNQREHIFWLGISFDVIVTATSILIPVLFFGLRFNKLTWVGIAFILLGLIIIKEFGMKSSS